MLNPTDAITPALLTAFVVGAVGLLKQFIPAGSHQVVLTRILVVAVSLATIFADAYLPKPLLDNLVAGFSLGAGALGAYGLGKPAVTAAASAVSSISVSRKSNPVPATAPDAAPAA